MNFRRHNQWVAGLVATILAATAAFTIAVDAVGLWGTPAMRGFNSYKVRQSQYEHTYKARAFALHPTPAVFLGASRVKYGLRSAPYAALTGREAFNFGLGGVPIQLQTGLLAHALYHRPDLQEVVMGVGHHEFLVPDAEALARLRAEEHRLASPWPPFGDLARHTLTLTALRDAVATVQASRAEPDAHAYEPDGHGLNQPLILHLEKVGAREAFLHHARTTARIVGRLAFDPAGLAWVQAIADACRARGVQLTVFVPPVHAVEYEAAWGTPNWQVIERSKRVLAQVTPYWDFSGYNGVTTDPITRHMRYYFDIAHFRPAAGDMIFARMYGGPGALPGFGRYVTAATVEDALAQVRAERAAWVASDPPDLRLLAELLRKAAARPAAAVAEPADEPAP